MMLHSLTLLLIFTALLYERWTRSVTKNAVGLILVFIALNNALMANISYFYMNLCYERTYAEGVEMMMEIHDYQDEYDVKRIAVVGNRLDEVQYDSVDPQTGEMLISGRIHMLTSLLEKDLMIDSEHTIRFLNATFGLDLEVVGRTESNKLMNTDEVKAMGCWPDGDSIAVVHDILVIKLSE